MCSATKPAWEPITLARRPPAGTVAQNVLEHGVGGLNIGGTRDGWRYPANVLLDEDAAELIGHGSRFMYVAKASPAERDSGISAFAWDKAGKRLAFGAEDGAAGVLVLPS